MPYEVGGHHRDEASLGHDPRLDVVELQTCVGTGHLACNLETKNNEVTIYSLFLSFLSFILVLVLMFFHLKQGQCQI